MAATPDQLDKYFQEKERELFLSKGYKTPTIGDHNTALAIIRRTNNELERQFCKAIMSAFRDSEPVHPGILKNLSRLREKHGITRIKLQ